MHAGPLIKLIKKGVEFTWGVAQKRAFEFLKYLLTNAPCLAIYDPTHRTRVCSDASSSCVGAVLEQLGTDDLWHPVEFFSKSMTST